MINSDNTMLGDFAKCDVMGVVKHVFGLRGKAEKIAAEIGNAYHDALEVHFKGGNVREVVGAFEPAYDRVIPIGEQPREVRFERTNCIKILEQYCEVRPVDKFPFVPLTFEEIKGCALDEAGEFVFWVKRDMVGQDKGNGEITPIDHKTTGNMTDWWAKKYRLVSQMSGYCWFTGREYGVEVGRCYINGIEVKKLPDSNKRCATHGVKYVECGHLHTNFQLYNYVRSKEQLEKWKQDALVIMKRVEILEKAFGGDIGLLPCVLKQGAFNEGCVFCELKEWCVRGFDPAYAEEFTVYDPWRPWEAEGAVRIDV